MKKTLLLFLATAILTLPASMIAQTPRPAAGKDAARALDEAWAAAMKANDPEAVMRCYAADAVAWLPDSPEARGEAAIREAYRALFAANRIEDVKFSDARYETAGDRSLAWGKFQLTLVPKASGTPVTMSGRFSEMAEKRNGRWVYVLDHASAEPAPAAAAPHN
ncbi:MAG: SgcJ/EcaC family oxidoreductase [Acidobacteriota bacterium]|nr:SgcJ/EcaC family oxidoreductase [Acidobacteriota bacterium]